MRTFIGTKFYSIILKLSYQVDMDFEKTGSKKCIQEFMAKESMDCMVMVKSGFLKMNGCTLSLEYVCIIYNI